MIRLTKNGDRTAQPDASVALTLDQRSRSRLRVTLDDGREAGIFLERGDSLKDGDLLVSEDRTIVLVNAASEPVSTVVSRDPLLISRACYHLGNRHAALQIEPGRLRFLRDHVLDEMVRGLGLKVITEEAPFEPEPGAYGGSVHSHAHDTAKESRIGRGDGRTPAGTDAQPIEKLGFASSPQPPDSKKSAANGTIRTASHGKEQD